MTSQRGRAFIALTMATGLVLVGCSDSGAGSSGEGESLTLTVSHLFGPNSWEEAPVTEFAEELTSLSGGQLQFEHHYSGGLVDAGDEADALADGLADLMILRPAYDPAGWPVANWAARMALFATPQVPQGVLAAVGAQNQWALNEPDLLEEFDRKGIVPLAAMPSLVSYDLLCSSEPVTTLTDAENTRVRVGGEIWAEEARNLSMQPVQLAGSEVYEGFERGVVDCAMINPPTYIAQGLWEIADHYTAANFTGWEASYLVISANAWESLSAQQQEWIREGLPSFVTGVYTNMFDEYENFFTAGTEQYGITIHDMAADMSAKIDDYHASLIDGGLADHAPSSVADPQAVIDRRAALEDEWLNTRVAALDLGPSYESWYSWVQEGGPSELNLEPWSLLFSELNQG